MICCICGSEIFASEKDALKLRVTNLWLDSETAPSQVLAAHAACFRSVLHMSIPFDSEVLAEVD
jgi:hypothetical protein